jgi:hypothetical protein
LSGREQSSFVEAEHSLETTNLAISIVENYDFGMFVLHAWMSLDRGAADDAAAGASFPARIFTF